MEAILHQPTVFQVSFGSSWAGLNTVGYTLYNVDNSVHEPFSMSGVVNEGGGYYHTVLTFDTLWTGYIQWAISQGSGITANEDITVIQGSAVAPVGHDTSSDPLIYDYKIGVKKQLIEALSPVFGSNYPDERLRGKIHVTLEYPQEEVQLPLILITFSEGPVENVGVGHSEQDFDDFGEPVRIHHWRFQGRVNFNVIARSPLERDLVSAGLTNILAFGRDDPNLEVFSQRLDNDHFVPMTLLTDQIQPGGEGTMPPPWDTGAQNQLLFTNQYSIAAIGEFMNNPKTGDLIQISGVRVYPYLVGTPAPW